MHVRAAEPPTAAEASTGQRKRSPQPAVATALELQRAAGNRAAGPWIRALARKKHKRSKPADKPSKPAGIACALDADGTIRSADGATVIGFRDGESAFVTPGGKSPADATMGTLQTPDGKKSDVVALQEGVLAGDPGATRFTAKKKGRTLGALGGGSRLDSIVIRSGKPVEPADMPASITASVGTRISLHSGRTTVWRLIDFPSKDRRTSTTTWVQSNHDRKEFEDRRDEVRKELANLPSDEAKSVEDDLDIIAMVSIIEGPWRSKSPSWDKMASLGVFQWGATKKTIAKTNSSLGVFYKTLEGRAAAASKTAKADRTETDQFYIDAWTEATNAGLSISDGKLQIAGKDATGGEVESALATPMGTGKLRAYQLIAAKDWLDDLRVETARPMSYGATLLHPGFSAKGPAIKEGDRKIVIGRPTWATTVGDVCTSKKALALMANLLVNRPAWVNTVLWRALAPSDASTKTAALVTKLIAAQDAADASAPTATPAKGRKKGKGKAKAKQKPDITSSNTADAASYKALQELVFPPKTASVGQAQLLERLYTISLEMYRIENTTPTAEERAKRLVTTEVID